MTGRLEAMEVTLSRPIRVAIPTAAICLAGLFAYATIYTLQVGRPVLFPVVLGFLLALVLERPVRYLRRIGVPRPLGTAALLSALMIAVIAAFYSLSFPARTLMAELPEQLAELEAQVLQLEAAQTARELGEVADELNGDDSEPTVRVRGPGVVETLLAYAGSFGVGLAITVALAGLLLGRRNGYRRPSARAVYRRIERRISAYLGTITLINVGLGIATGAVMALLGVPNPVLLGALAGLLNFVIYLGPLAMVSLLGLVGLTTFDEPLAMALPALSFLGLNLIEAYVVTPVVVGQCLHLDPVWIVLSLAFWGFIWGVPGMLLAVPLLAVATLVIENTDLSAWITNFFTR